MSQPVLRPNGTRGVTAGLSGAATVHAALSDNSDASYVAFGSDAVRIAEMATTVKPAGSRYYS